MKINEDIKVLILPDIHGRQFWKAVYDFPIDKYPDLEIVFLGDYLDPYTGYEDITKEDAYNNFLEILGYIKSDKRVTALIGNHDWHYFVQLDSSRIDRARERQIEKLFVENMQYFKLIKEISINNVKYLFTHAGITSGWLEDIIHLAKYSYKIKEPKPGYEQEWNDFINTVESYDVDKENNFDILNECLKNYDDYTYTRFISMVGPERGGYFRDHGSLIWADVHEHTNYFNKPLTKYYQIFGHTITYPDGQYSYYIPDKDSGINFAMIDGSQPFVLTSDNKLKVYKKEDQS